MWKHQRDAGRSVNPLAVNFWFLCLRVKVRITLRVGTFPFFSALAAHQIQKPTLPTTQNATGNLPDFALVEHANSSIL